MIKGQSLLALAFVLLAITTTFCHAAEDEDDLQPDTVDQDLGSNREGSRTDDEVVKRDKSCKHDVSQPKPASDRGI